MRCRRAGRYSKRNLHYDRFSPVDVCAVPIQFVKVRLVNCNFEGASPLMGSKNSFRQPLSKAFQLSIHSALCSAGI